MKNITISMTNNFKNFTTITVQDESNLARMTTLLLNNYQSASQVQHLIQGGNLVHFGEDDHQPQVVQQYGINYWNTPQFQALPFPKKIAFQQEYELHCVAANTPATMQTLTELLHSHVTHYVYHLNQQQWYVLHTLPTKTYGIKLQAIQNDRIDWVSLALQAYQMDKPQATPQMLQTLRQILTYSMQAMPIVLKEQIINNTFDQEIGCLLKTQQA